MDLWPELKTAPILNLWPTNQGLGSAVDIRQEIKDLFEGTVFSPQRAHWAILRRSELTQKCTCLKMTMRSGKYLNEPDPDCNICSGMGYIYDDELHLVRRVTVSPTASPEHLTDIGYLQVPFIVYYLRYFVHPSSKDEIIEIELNPDGSVLRPINYLQFFKIDMAEPLRGAEGKIEYYRCSVNKRDI